MKQIEQDAKLPARRCLQVQRIDEPEEALSLASSREHTRAGCRCDSRRGQLDPLIGGGGVDGAIHRRGGPSILEESRQSGARSVPPDSPAGSAVKTGGGLIRARHVIRAVGPVWRSGDDEEPKVLASCSGSSLEIAKAEAAEEHSLPGNQHRRLRVSDGRSGKVGLGAVREFVEREGGTRP